jgi:AcrR family transcriptional regulator
VLNEAKCRIVPKQTLATEEPDLEALFDAAVDEIAQQISDEAFDADYGFQSEWDEEPPDEEDLELQATTALFDSIGQYPGQEENIERFCLPLFASSGSVHAVEHVKEAFKKRASMAQIYVSYLAKFIDDAGVREFLIQMFKDADLADWQRMWVAAALLQGSSPGVPAVGTALTLLKDTTRHDALRAVAAVIVGRYGDHARRKSLATLYPSVSDYVKSAIYYSSRWWPGAEKANAKAMWGAHGELHEFLTIAMSKT